MLSANSSNESLLAQMEVGVSRAGNRMIGLIHFRAQTLRLFSGVFRASGRACSVHDLLCPDAFEDKSATYSCMLAYVLLRRKFPIQQNA
jgi:hypothetical protein